MQETALTAFTAFFVTIGPIPAAAVFASLTHGTDRAYQWRTAAKGTLVAGVILIVFAIPSDDLLEALGISLAGVRIGGGILLMLLSINVVFGREAGSGAQPVSGSPQAAEPADIAVFPLATPLLAGPGAITTVMVVVSHVKADRMAELVAPGMLLLVLVITATCLLAAARIERLLGRPG